MNRKGIEDFYSVSEKANQILSPDGRSVGGGLNVLPRVCEYFSREFAKDLAAAVNLGREIRIRRESQIRKKEAEESLTFGDLAVGDRFHWKNGSIRPLIKASGVQCRYPNGELEEVDTAKKVVRVPHEAPVTVNQTPERSEGVKHTFSYSPEPVTTYDTLQPGDYFIWWVASEGPFSNPPTCRKLDSTRFTFRDNKGNLCRQCTSDLGQQKVKQVYPAPHNNNLEPASLFEDLDVGEWFQKIDAKVFIYHKDNNTQYSQHCISQDGNPGEVSVPNVNVRPHMPVIRYTPPMCKAAIPIDELSLGSYFTRPYLKYKSDRDLVLHSKKKVSHNGEIHCALCITGLNTWLKSDELVTPVKRIRAREVQMGTLFVRLSLVAADTMDNRRLYHRKQDGSVWAYGPKPDGVIDFKLNSDEIVTVVEDQVEEVHPRNNLV